MSEKIEHSDKRRHMPLDALRGLIIVFMALDHANYFIAQQHPVGEHWGGSFPGYTSTLPALTRLITHLSAPGFFFLMGVGMFLFAKARQKSGWSNPQIISHFWIRGALLIGLQFLVINRIWEAGPDFFPETYIGVLSALGGCMIIGSLFTSLNPITLLILSLGLLVGTEWLHPSPEMWGSLENNPWSLVFMRSGGDGTLWSNYPILPWLELVLFGMLFGNWLHADNQKAYQKALRIGIALLAIFILLRGLNGFGNIRPQQGESWIDFLNVVKYPPSMVFTFLTIGINLVILWAFSAAGQGIQRYLHPLAVFGSEPLLMYVTHLVLYMLIGKYMTVSGTAIPAMLPYWLVGLALLYPLALWYGRFKSRRSLKSSWRFI